MAFLADYPMARAFLLYGGTKAYKDGPIQIMPAGEFLKELPDRLT